MLEIRSGKKFALIADPRQSATAPPKNSFCHKTSIPVTKTEEVVSSPIVFPLQFADLF